MNITGYTAFAESHRAAVELDRRNELIRRHAETRSARGELTDAPAEAPRTRTVTVFSRLADAVRGMTGHSPAARPAH